MSLDKSPERAVSPPPQLHFDDGSRIIMQESTCNNPDHTIPAVRGSIPINIYYEIDRLAEEIVAIAKGKEEIYVALQFPDSLLEDAPEVCWAFEEALGMNALVFVLGDTTFGACCPDEVSALHLNASVLVHYGHACLSPSLQLPVLYSFGISNIDVEACVEAISKQIVTTQKASARNFLLLYQVEYQHAMEELRQKICDIPSDISVIIGKIPSMQQHMEEGEEDFPSLPEKVTKIAGLEVPTDLDLTTMTLLYIGDSNADTNRQYVNMMMQLISQELSPLEYWTLNPLATSPLTVECDAHQSISRQLNRRFYLIQKARDATTFGILVGTLSQRHFARAVAVLQQTILKANRACYTFAVGKLNPAKLANFGEIDAYVLVTCPEHSLLTDDREFHVPVITPLELDICLGNAEWGAYSLDYHDFIRSSEGRTIQEVDTDVDDAPYFSLVDGTLKDSRKLGASREEIDLQALPGQGQLMTHHSAGAEYLRNRSYQGLDTQLGQTEVHAAKMGQTGIASRYDNNANENGKQNDL